MGIFNFFSDFRRRFNSSVIKLSPKEDLKDINIFVDNLFFDLNGIIHNSCQKIYKYGNFAPQSRLLSTPIKIENNYQTNLEVFKDICYSIEYIFDIVEPKKKMVIAIDGPPPLAKICQQRQRRFKNSSTPEISNFDSSCISPGTEFMHNLSKYIDLFIKRKITEDEKWRKIKVVFSNEKVPGEGESILINYIKKFGDKKETYMIHGSDADILMLSLGTHFPNFYVLRDDLYDKYNKYLVVNIHDVRLQLGEIILVWESDKYDYDIENAIDDFIFLCFLLGNDFLPHLPALEILEDGIDIIIDIYKNVAHQYGHIIKNNRVSKIPLKHFLKEISVYEKQILENKLLNKKKYFPDELLESCASYNSGKFDLDIEKYKTQYNKKHFNVSIKKISHLYLEGLDWVYKYYSKNSDFNWNWMFTHYYAPFASDIVEHIDSYKELPSFKSTNISPFEQLLCILPPSSSHLLPEPLRKILTDPKSILKPYLPDEIKIDLSGKKMEYQGIILLPFINLDVVKRAYNNNLKYLHEIDVKRNKCGKVFQYSYDTNIEYFIRKFKCKTKTEFINL